MLLEEPIRNDQCVLLAKLLAFALLHFVLQGQTCLLLQVYLLTSCFCIPAPYATSITRRSHYWALFSLWLSLLILFMAVPPLFSSSLLGTYRPGEFIFQCHIFLPFHTVHGFSRQEYWSGLPLPSPVGHILSELSTMIHLSFVALQGMAHSFIELDKALIHVISLISFL